MYYKYDIHSMSYVYNMITFIHSSYKCALLENILCLYE